MEGRKERRKECGGDNKLWYIYTVEYYSAINKNEVLIDNLDESKINYAEGKKPDFCKFPFIYN